MTLSKFPFSSCLKKKLYLRQRSITDLQHILDNVIKLSSRKALCFSSICPLTDRKWKAGAAGVIIPDITSRTIKPAARGHAEEAGTTGVVRDAACGVLTRLIYWCDFIMRWNDTIIFYQQRHRWTSEEEGFIEWSCTRLVLQLKSLFAPLFTLCLLTGVSQSVRQKAFALLTCFFYEIDSDFFFTCIRSTRHILKQL